MWREKLFYEKVSELKCFISRVKVGINHQLILKKITQLALFDNL